MDPPHTAPPEFQADTTAWLATAHELADAARAVSLRHFRAPLDVQRKADASPVTQADRETEAVMRALLAARHPSHGIVGEEHGAVRRDAGLVWMLDPIDGTKSYVCGMPQWGTLVALLHGPVCELGLVDMPVLDERWVALRDGPAWFIAAGQAPRECRTSGCTALSDARLCAAGPDAFDSAGRLAFDALAVRAALVRHGGDCHAYGLLASGHLDLVVDAGLEPHDFLPMRPLVEAAGGVITDWQGRPLHPGSAGQVLAAASVALHRQALPLLAPAAGTAPT